MPPHPPFKYTAVGRSYKWLDQWWRWETTKGQYATSPNEWGRHPSWGDDLNSKAYAANRHAWHKNLGELLNFHSTVRIASRNSEESAQLRVNLYHDDVERLHFVREVVGGTVSANDSGLRNGFLLRIERQKAFLTLKCGRLYVDPENTMLLEAFNAMMQCFRHIPARGTKASEQQLATQLYWKDQVNGLMDVYEKYRGDRTHDCREMVKCAGGVRWGRPSPYGDDPLLEQFTKADRE